MSDISGKPPKASSGDPDLRLVHRCRDELPYGTSAFEELLRKYEPQIYRTCLQYLKSESDAQEAAQDVFLRVFHAIDKFREQSTFKTWLYRITTNVCATYYAKRQRERDRKEAYEREFLIQSEVLGNSIFDKNVEEGPIGRAILQLSITDQEMLTLRHLSELSLEEIATALDLKLSATKMRLYRAEERLRAAYDDIVMKS